MMHDADNVFASEWCMVELEAAVRSGVNVILVRKSGARWADAAGNYDCEHPPESLIQEQEKCTQDTLRSSRAIKHSDEYYKIFCERLVAQLESPEVAAVKQLQRAAMVRTKFGDAAEQGTPATTSRTTRRLSMSHTGGGAHHRPTRSVSLLPQFAADGFGDATSAGDAGDAAAAASLAPAAEPAVQQQLLQQSMRDELAHLRLAVQTLRDELAAGARVAEALRRGAGDAPVARALALLPAWISAVGTLCCVVLAAVALRALRLGAASGGVCVA
jgi:hypothetical protein